MSHRDKKRRPLLTDAVIRRKGSSWNDATQKVVRTDAIRILESLVAEFGVERCVAAMINQGFDGDAYRYLLVPLFEEASVRRAGSNDPP